MKLYRAMCEKEFNETLNYNSLSFKNRYKWFGTEEFVLNRVKDGKFNNSHLVSDRYKYILVFDIEDNYLKYFEKCGNREFMLDRRKANLIKIDKINIYGNN